jgi:two-component sensor histidine kinase/ligand-binding sensor domain-containing protein
MKSTTRHINRLILLFALFVNSFLVYAQRNSANQNYIITKRMLSVEDGLPSRTINAAAQDNVGFIWFVTASGLSRYDGSHFKTFNIKNSKLLSNAISSIAIDAENHLLLIFSQPVNKNGKSVYTQVLDLKDYSFKDFDEVFPKLPFHQNQIQSLSSDKAGSLIFYIANTHQIWQYNKKSGFAILCAVKSLSEKDSVFSRVINSSHPMYITDKYHQWYVRQGEEYIMVRDTNDIRNSGENGIVNVFRDKLNNFWFCTTRGVFQVTIRENKFQHFFSGKRNIDFEYSIRGIYADVNHTNDDENKIFALSQGTNLRIQSNNTEREIASTPGFALIKKNDIFYITSTGLISYNPINKVITPLIANAKINEIWSLASISDSILILGGSSGMMLFNEHTNQTQPILLQQNIKQLPVFVYRFVKTTNKGWIAIAENGIYFINERFEVYDYYSSQHTQSEKRLPFTGIYDFYEDKEGVAWLAMNGAGLIRWNWNATNPMAAEQFRQFTVDNGLPDNILYRIEEDAFNNLWISSYNGLVRFNKNTFSTKVYHSKDGLDNAEFNRVSSFKDENGKIYFGGFKGVDALNPWQLKDDKEENDVSFQLVEFTKFSAQENKLIDVLYDFNFGKKLTMQFGDRFLTVSFSLLDFENRIHRYAYRIEGVDKDWNYISENSIRISGLPYGDLKLHIKAQLSSGVWNTQEIIIPIEVLKPYYLQTWFWIFSFTALIILFLFIYFTRINRLQKANLNLEYKVQERTYSLTQTLNEKDLLLSEKNILLTEVHHRVKNNLQVINGLLELRKEGIEDEKARAAFDEGKNGVASIAMIHELLYRNEITGTLEFSIIAQNLTTKTAQLFATQKKHIEFNFGSFDIKLNLDQSITLGLILNELLMNAYKYLPAQKNNMVKIDLMKTNEGNYIFIFHDNGPGLENEIQFEKANTIGFSIIKRLAKQLKGKASYTFDYGSKFVIQFAASEKGYQS